MKRQHTIWLWVLALCLTAGCASAPASVPAADGWVLPADVEAEYVSQWPENEFTACIPQPEAGSLDYIRDFSADGRYQIVLRDIPEEDSAAYVKALREYGYAEVFSEGNEVSVGTLLEKDGIVLSLAYSDTMLNLLITLPE